MPVQLPWLPQLRSDEYRVWDMITLVELHSENTLYWGSNYRIKTPINPSEMLNGNGILKILLITSLLCAMRRPMGIRSDEHPELHFELAFTHLHGLFQLLCSFKGVFKERGILLSHMPSDVPSKIAAVFKIPPHPQLPLGDLGSVEIRDLLMFIPPMSPHMPNKLLFFGSKPRHQTKVFFCFVFLLLTKVFIVRADWLK